MDVPEWAVEAGKVGLGAVAGVFAGTRRMESRVRALEDRAKAADTAVEHLEGSLGTLTAAVEAKREALTRIETKVDLIMDAMQLRPRT